jgi:imidazolonepropionase-like amidohydrolase
MPIQIKAALMAPVSCVVLGIASASAQPTSDSVLADRPNGMKQADPTHHVFINATVHPEPGVVWKGIVQIRDGMIVSATNTARASVKIPEGATVHDLEGEHIYAAFIDPYVEIDAPTPDGDTPGAHWNPNVHPWRSALDGDGLPSSAAESHRKLGYGAAVVVPKGGVFAGSAAAVSLAEKPGDDSLAHVGVYRDNVYQAVDFQTSGWTTRSYPTSTPGAVALMRQTLIDADWQAANAPTLDGSNPRNALTPLEDASVPLLFTLDHELEHFLADDIAGEFNRPAVVVGNGMEFKWLDGIAAIGRPVILPLRFPAQPDVSSVGKAESVELETMMTWEQAPTNPMRLREKMEGVDLALTVSELPSGRKFHDELRSAIEHGLRADEALAMLTTGPAAIAGLSDQLGTIEAGKRANLVVASGPLFELGTKDSTIHDVWIDGVRHRIADRDGPSFDGTWRMWMGDEAEPAFEMTLEISGSTGKKPKIVASETWDPALPEGEAGERHESDARKISIEDDRISFLMDDDDDEQVTYIVSGVLVGDDRMIGTGVASDDSAFGWSARKVEAESGEEDDAGDTDASDGKKDEKEPEIKEVPPLPGYPFGPYARRFDPVQETLLFTGATVWTGTDRGMFDKGWLFIRGGRVLRCEPGDPPAWMLDGSNEEISVIDVSGMHITPGLIDAHSHTSLFRFGVNEAGQAVTAEVRIGDSLDPGAINWYRQLAMGVTTVNSLHGSANPIGGQNAVHKVRWGAKTPGEMLLEGARPGIKFALGENVKQSNWNLSNSERTRYPQTRLGVETVIRDRFEAAREYAVQRALTHVSSLNDAEEARTGVRPIEVSAPPTTDDAVVNYGLRYGKSLPRGTRFRSGALPQRRDLELEALAEILAGERLIHCHSYRQDEILMLCKVAEDFGFTIGTFQHGLEVYKVAEAVSANAIGASLFSDWWMYKVEVMDAIPFAGPLQTEAGVLTSYNSDSDELARRMNTEAAKAVKYARPGSGLTEHDALKFVTANPAIQIGAGSTGRLEESLDADFVVWTDHPLSTRARADRVYIDGAEYYSIEQDRIARERIARERQRLIQKIVANPKKKAEKDGNGEGEGSPDTEAPPLVDSPPDRLARQGDLLEGVGRDRRGVLIDWMRSGFHPDDMRPGDCGCNIINHAQFYEFFNNN